MRTDDQWFEPGDKVTKVISARDLGLKGTPFDSPLIDYGKILCVAVCWRESDGWNSVKFVGVENSRPELGWYACCFRRVSEIKLCVRAAKRLSNPVGEPETAEAQA